MVSIRTYLKSVDWLTPLPLPESYQEKAFRLSAARQLSISFMLNILSLAVPIMMLQVYDRIIPHQSYGTLSMLTLGVLIALAFDCVLRMVRAWLISWTAASNEHIASCAALDHFSRADLSIFEKTGTGEHIQNLSALGRLREFYSGQALTALIDLPFAVLFLALVAYLGGWLVLVPIGVLVTFFALSLVAGAQLRRALENRHHADDLKSNTVVSILSGIHSVKALGLESSLLRRFEETQGQVSNHSYSVSMASGTASILSSSFGQISLILTGAVGALLVIYGGLTVGGLSACTLLAGRSIQPIQRVLGTWLRVQDLTIAKQQALSLFALPARPVMAEEQPDIMLSGHISLDRASFSFPDSDTPLLNKISLEIEPGQCIAINGDKSSGKSTLLQMIAGLVKPTDGNVRLDELDPAQYGLSDLIGQVGYLPQEGAIFRGTLQDNITGFRDDELSIEKARHAGVDLGLDQLVDSLAHGYQTMLTDTAADPIPPGIKQRIALARVLMHQPRILLFDDADRALDKEGYNRLFRLMGRLKGSCTVVMVSHDRNLLSFADQSYYLENGILRKDESRKAAF